MTSLERVRGEASVKLLDEAVSELDRRRQASFLENLQGQVLFATTREIDDFGKHFSVTDGTIQETN
jgi:recombinational DNA repair ATPase RecF